MASFVSIAGYGNSGADAFLAENGLVSAVQGVSQKDVDSSVNGKYSCQTAMDVTPLRAAIFQSGELQIVIAKKASIHETRLSKIARGHVSATADEKERLAKALDSSVAELFPDEAVAS